MKPSSPFLASASLFLYCNCMYAAAADWQQTLSAKIGAESDSNPAMSATSPEPVWRGILIPGYALTGDTGSSRLQMNASVLIERSQDETRSKNRTNPSASIDWTYMREDGDIGLSAKYGEISTRNSAADVSVQTPINSTRISKSVGGSWNYSASTRTAISASLDSESVSYNGGSFVDFKTRSAELAIKYNLNDKNDIFIRQRYADFETIDGSQKLALSSSLLGWTWQTTEEIDITLQGGEYHSTSADSATQGGALMNFQGETSEFSMGVQRQVVPSGLGGFSVLDQANVKYSKSLSEYRKTGVELTAQKNNNTGFSNGAENLWLQNELNPDWSMRIYYTHYHFQGAGIDGAASDLIGISFKYINSNF